MRTFLAMVFAIAAAAFTSLTISQNVADNVVVASAFEAPDAVATAHAAAFMGTSLLALLAGWVTGWVLGYPLRRR